MAQVRRKGPPKQSAAARKRIEADCRINAAMMAELNHKIAWALSDLAKDLLDRAGRLERAAYNALTPAEKRKVGANTRFVELSKTLDNPGGLLQLLRDNRLFP